MLHEETAAEGGEPLLDDVFVIFSTEGNRCQEENFRWAEAETQEVIDKEVVQFVRANQIFGLLLDVALFVGWNQFRADRCINNVEQGVA